MTKKQLETVIANLQLLNDIRRRIWIFNSITTEKQLETVIVNLWLLNNIRDEYEYLLP